MDSFLILLIIAAPLVLTISLTAQLSLHSHWLYALVPVLHAVSIGWFTWDMATDRSNTGDATPGVFFAYLVIFLIIHVVFSLAAVLCFAFG